MCMCLDIHMYTKCPVYDTYNKQGQIIWSCRDLWSITEPRTKKEAYMTFRTVTLSVLIAA